MGEEEVQEDEDCTVIRVGVLSSDRERPRFPKSSKSAAGVEGKRGRQRQFEASLVNCLQEGIEDVDALLLVASARRGRAKDGGAVVRCSRWFSHREEKEEGDGGGDAREKKGREARVSGAGARLKGGKEGAGEAWCARWTTTGHAPVAVLDDEDKGGTEGPKRYWARRWVGLEGKEEGAGPPGWEEKHAREREGSMRG
jgi:hypothetical protein